MKEIRDTAIALAITVGLLFAIPVALIGAAKAGLDLRGSGAEGGIR